MSLKQDAIEAIYRTVEIKNSGFITRQLFSLVLLFSLVISTINVSVSQASELSRPLNVSESSTLSNTSALSQVSLESSKHKLLVKQESITTKQLANDVKSILVAELYHQLGASKLGVSHYMDIALRNDNPAIAKRATEIATRTRQLSKGLKMARRWVELSPNSLQSRQYLALLLLRDNQSEKSSKQLFFINDIVENSSKDLASSNTSLYSKGLKFIGAMLLIESHHKKALKVFDAYLKEYSRKNYSKQKSNYKSQQYLVRASLAEKANDYSAILESINNYESVIEGTNHQLPNIVSMKLKALQKLNKKNEAVSYLIPIIDNNKGSDSLQLELVRMLILDKQRSRATPYLLDLVSKHPDNNDLLKSLIALQIDQKELKKAQDNIFILKKTKEYDNDAKYFSAELLEAKGDFLEALESYKKVKAGILLKRAKKKVNSLTLRLNKELQSKVNYLNSK